MDAAPEPQPAEGKIQDPQERLRRLASELSLAEARERREIASDLHDHIGQALAFVFQKVSTMRGNSIFSGMDEDFSQILTILDQTIRYTRDLTVEISPPILYELGLPAAIEWQAERAYQVHELEVSFSESGVPSEFDEAVKVFTLKAVQELLHNVAKHAEASRAKIHADWGRHEFEVVVTDDGRGYDATRQDSQPASDCCFGLFNIRERLSYIGGALTISSSPGRGTRVSVVSPYRMAAKDHGDPSTPG
jgi:signal transduction histidine kinase